MKFEDPVHAATLRVVEAMGATADLYKMPLKLALALIDLEKAVKPGLEQQLANTLAKKCDELQADLTAACDATNKLRKLLEETQVELVMVKRERNYVAADDDAFWLWSDTDPNGLDSLSERSLVKMTAGQLRRLLAQERLAGSSNDPCPPRACPGCSRCEP